MKYFVVASVLGGLTGCSMHYVSLEEREAETRLQVSTQVEMHRWPYLEMFEALRQKHPVPAIEARYTAKRPPIPVYQDLPLTTWDLLGSGHVSGVSLAFDLLFGLSEVSSEKNVTATYRALRKRYLYDPMVVYHHRVSHHNGQDYEQLFQDANTRVLSALGTGFHCQVSRFSKTAGFAYANSEHAQGRYHSREMDCRKEGGSGAWVTLVSFQLPGGQATSMVSILKTPVVGGYASGDGAVGSGLVDAAAMRQLKFGLYEDTKAAFEGWEAIATGFDPGQPGKWIGIWADGQQKVKFDLPNAEIPPERLKQVMAQRAELLGKAGL